MSDIMCVCVAIVSGFSIIYLNGMSSLSEMYLHFNCVLAFNVCVCHFNLCFIHSEAIVWYIICLWASHIFLSLCVCVCVCQIRADNLYMFSHLYARVARWRPICCHRCWCDIYMRVSICRLWLWHDSPMCQYCVTIQSVCIRMHSYACVSPNACCIQTQSLDYWIVVRLHLFQLAWKVSHTQQSHHIPYPIPDHAITNSFTYT